MNPVGGDIHAVTPVLRPCRVLLADLRSARSRGGYRLRRATGDGIGVAFTGREGGIGLFGRLCQDGARRQQQPKYDQEMTVHIVTLVVLNTGWYFLLYMLESGKACAFPSSWSCP